MQYSRNLAKSVLTGYQNRLRQDNDCKDCKEVVRNDFMEKLILEYIQVNLKKKKKKHKMKHFVL